MHRTDVTRSKVLVPCEAWDAVVDQLRHLGTTVRPDSNNPRLWCGNTRWGAAAAGRLIRLGWDWLEIRQGVLAITNPMSISSNIVLVDELDSPVDMLKNIVHLNNAVFSLPWQKTVNAQFCRLGSRGLSCA